MDSLFSNIDLFYEPRKLCFSVCDFPEGEPEMSEFESAFLCGLLKQRRPHKILEVGVAAGGTTAIIVKCLEILGLENECEMYSVDIAEYYYRDEDKESGYLAKNLITNHSPNLKHKFLFGKLLPSVIDEIGHDIDFVILDTVHVLPGEILDFLAIYPYLSQNACVVLHDIALNHYELAGTPSYATQVLFSCIDADKILMQDDTKLLKYPNIGAVIINDNTKKSIKSIFNSLLITWRYKISDSSFSVYYNHYVRYYGEQVGTLFSTIYELQNRTYDIIMKNKAQLISRDSVSYKVGSLFTWIPRKMYQLLKG